MKKADDIDPLDRKFSLASLSGKGVRGKYYSRVKKGSNLVRLSPEVAHLFPTEAAVNQALLSLAELSKSLPHLTKRPASSRAKAPRAR
ncbi:MAG: hypothetical protein H7X91_00820 [Burkholderiales bacterium]|nr:hypothetical protein [Burkholderiales bacterium]